jgi:hypothetical protein
MTTVPRPMSIPPRQLPGRRYDRYFFGGMVVALLVTAFAGFAPTYYLAGLTSAKLPAPIVHVHAVLQSAWMLLLLVQMLLVSAKRVAIHRKLGIAGFLLAAAMVVVAEVVVANQLHRLASQGDYRLSYSLIPQGEVLNFAVLAGSACALRRYPATHKRLIILATIAMMPAAIVRIPVPLIEQWIVWEVLAFVVALQSMTSGRCAVFMPPPSSGAHSSPHICLVPGLSDKPQVGMLLRAGCSPGICKKEGCGQVIAYSEVSVRGQWRIG